MMSLQDPTKKMSKSDATETNYVGLLEDPKRILRKIKRAVTDSENEIRFSPDKPGVSNLLSISSAITGESIDSLVEGYAGQGYGALKVGVAEQVVECLEPVQARYKELREDRELLDNILAEGAAKARARAQDTLRKTQDALGFVPPKR